MPERWDELFDSSATEKFIIDPLSIPSSVISYCEKCDRFFDVRSGCPADIQSQETAVDEHHKELIPK